MKGVARLRLVVAGLALTLALAGCATTENSSPSDSGGGDTGSGGSGSGAAERINGAGSSFIAPFLTKAAQNFAQDGGIQVNYQSIGSSGGREQLIKKTVAFGASDAPMSAEEEQQAGGKPLHIATIAGAAVAAYNLDGVGKINLTGPVLADIFLGKITAWNDPAIADLNPSADLPSSDIAVVHRSDGSGTTNIFSSYLAAISPDWKNGPGAGDELDWPVGIGADGNEGVAGQVQQTPNSIGYVGLEYAVANDISYANIGEKAGKYVEPSVDSAQLAIEQAADADEIPDDLKVTISSLAPFEGDAYPITGFTWLLARQQMDDAAECKAVAEFAWYMTHDAQDLAPDLNYVPMPDNIVSTDEEFIKSMEAGGQKCYGGS